MFSLRIVLRGLRDTIDHILAFIVATLAFWLGVGSIIAAPAALLTLFYVADPRHGVERDRPTAAGTLLFARTRFWRSWALALATIPLAVLFCFNTIYYGRHGGVAGALAPLWLVLFLLSCLIALASFSVSALLDRPMKASLRLGFLITGKALPRYALVGLFVVVLALIGTFLILPAVLFLPATIAAIIDRTMLRALGIPVLDPNQPTAELLAEQEITGKPSRLDDLLRRR